MLGINFAFGNYEAKQYGHVWQFQVESFFPELPHVHVALWNDIKAAVPLLELPHPVIFNYVKLV